MKKVRKDVIEKLIKGLNDKREEALKFGSSIPKRFQYETSKAKHWIYRCEEEKTYYLGSELYNGERCYSKISF